MPSHLKKLSGESCNGSYNEREKEKALLLSRLTSSDKTSSDHGVTLGHPKPE